MSLASKDASIMDNEEFVTTEDSATSQSDSSVSPTSKKGTFVRFTDTSSSASESHNKPSDSPKSRSGSSVLPTPGPPPPPGVKKKGLGPPPALVIKKKVPGAPPAPGVKKKDPDPPPEPSSKKGICVEFKATSDSTTSQSDSSVSPTSKKVSMNALQAASSSGSESRKPSNSTTSQSDSSKKGTPKQRKGSLTKNPLCKDKEPSKCFNELPTEVKNWFGIKEKDDKEKRKYHEETLNIGRKQQEKWQKYTNVDDDDEFCFYDKEKEEIRDFHPL